MDSLLIVIPAHNEADTIASVIQGLNEHGFYRVLVVDDASSDGTANLASDSGAQVISLPYNMGAWKATQAGIRYAYEQHYNYVITFDADGQHVANSLNTLIGTLKESEADVVIGSCPSRGTVSRHIAWKMFRTLSGISVKDLTSGLRLYNHAAIAVLSSKEATLLEYQDVGVLLLLRAFNLKKAEVIVPMEERIFGISRIFYSWGAVAYYMVYTSMLCISKVARSRQYVYQQTLNRD